MSRSSAVSRAQELLHSLEGRPLDRAARAGHAVELAELLLARSHVLTTSEERARAGRFARLMNDPAGQRFTTALTDRLYRSRDPGRVLDQFSYLLERHGVPRSMQLREQALLQVARVFAPASPAAIAEAVARRVRSEARSVLLDADERALSAYLEQRHRERTRVNVNQLGEALLGEREAEQRVAKYVELAGRRGVDALSVKVSSVASQLNLLAFEATTELVAERLARIYRATLNAGEQERALVMLDMEAYAHTELTLAALEQGLAHETLDRVRAGVVLQAYLPDTGALLTRVLRFAAQRVARGGLPLRIRLVKGANLAHERVESAKAGQSVPMLATKTDVDANYKRLLERAATAENARSVQLGVASHNLFELAYALVLRAERALATSIEVELLEGMAEPVRRALLELDVGVLSYAPICRDDEFNSGIAYLVRRLDENTAPENYLRASFALASEGREQQAALALERSRFLFASSLVDQVDETPQRAGDRGFDRVAEPVATPSDVFRGEPDTDFARAPNRLWIERALGEAREAAPRTLLSRIAGREVGSAGTRAGVDPSRPNAQPHQLLLASADELEQAIAHAAADQTGFSGWPPAQRANLLLRCAAALRSARSELIASMVLEAGKRVVEADVEVSEAIDFAEYYRVSFMQLVQREPVAFTPRGVVLVTPPWNFPLAIAAGGIFAALMAGCRVLFKPPLETALVGEKLARLLWSAGVPESALQLVLCEDEVASALVRDPRVDVVILTGATSTARLFQRLRPGLHLLAETGGKNAYIVSAMSDRELAIRDVVHSAFGHAGQKCSAASLLICEEEVYADPHFRGTLRDAVESLPVGSAWDAESFVTPLIRRPEEPLLRALTTLEPGEEWLVAPHIDPSNPRLVRPGVKLGVKPQSFTHTTELFGPVLAMMRARDLSHAIELANATGYGLTAGLASLDEREQAYFCEHIRAGNVYVNRTITGAIVERQPFGGMGKSGFGPGAKAGGPNYVAQLCHVSERARSTMRASVALPAALRARVVGFSRLLGSSDEALLYARVQDYHRAHDEHFAREHDPAQILGQYNRFRYRPCEGVILRVEPGARMVDVAASCIAAELAGARIVISLHPRAEVAQDAGLFAHPQHVGELGTLSRELVSATRLRLLGARSIVHDQLSAEHGFHIADAPVVALGRFELLHYLREQSLSIEYHRYGNLGE